MDELTDQNTILPILEKVNDMKTETVRTLVYEKTIISIMRDLSTDRVSQLVDFAKFLQNQSTVNKLDEKAKEKIRTGEEKWNKLFADPEAKQMMREMANEAIEDYRTGKTTEIAITEDGKLEPA